MASHTPRGRSGKWSVFPSAIFLCYAPSYGAAAAPISPCGDPEKIEEVKNERSNYAALIVRFDIERATIPATLSAFAWPASQFGHQRRSSKLGYSPALMSTPVPLQAHGVAASGFKKNHLSVEPQTNHVIKTA